MRRLLLLTIACALASPAAAQGPDSDPVESLLGRFGQALNAVDRTGLAAMFDASVASTEINRYLAELLIPGAVKTTLLERGRGQLEGAPPGDGFTVIVEFFIETPGRARILTASMDLQRPPAGALESWRVVNAEGLTFVDGLYKLRLDTERPLQATNLEVTSEDLTLFLPSGRVYLVDSDEGVTGLVLLGRGRMQFSPTAEAERGQLRLFSGDDALDESFDSAFVRLSPLDYEERVSTDSLAPARPDERQDGRAREVFDREAAKSFTVDLQDLSSDAWHLLPASGDLMAEVDTRRFDTLTYSIAADRAEDISLYRREDSRTISLYPSVAKLAARGRFYSDDALRDYDVLDYDIQAYVDPENEVVSGRARLLIRIRSTSLTALRLRLADSLVVTGITSVEYGRLLHLRMRAQDMILVSLPRVMLQDSDLTLVITYAGRLGPQGLETDTVGVSPDPGAQLAFESPIEPTFLLSNQSYWYPQNAVPDYATATIRVVVPNGYTCVASGHPEPVGDLGALEDLVNERGGQPFQFSARQPLRYLALLVTRLRPGGERAVPIEDQVDPGSGVDSVAVRVLTHNSLRHRADPVAEETERIIRFYASLVGDAPYTAMSVALVENELPGGHSPGYFAVINTPQTFTSVNWRGDPASFNDYPEFFLAHEVAHQWWGQAVGWKNYHEQWLSEGLAQYFAALYAEHARGEQVFERMLEQFRRWGMSESDQGPVHLGARLGHIKGEPRVFRALVYNKAAGVVHMLRRLLGDEAFFRGLRRFYLDRRYLKAGTEDFERALELESGQVLDRFFERWIYGSGIPTVRYETDVADDEVLLRFEQTGDLVYDLPVTVRLEYRDGRNEQVVVPLTAAVVEESVPAQGAVRRVGVNRDSAALAEFDER